MNRLPLKFQEKISPCPMTGCWLWIGSTVGIGYGSVRFYGKVVPAHRAVYLLLKGVIPEELELDHLCRIPGCVNPDHLEPVTHRENMIRGEGTGARAVRTNTCCHGHFNKWRITSHGQRECIICKKARAKTDKYRERNIQRQREKRLLNREEQNRLERERYHLRKPVKKSEAIAPAA